MLQINLNKMYQMCSVGGKMEPTDKKFHEDITLGLHRNATNSVGLQANT